MARARRKRRVPETAPCDRPSPGLSFSEADRFRSCQLAALRPVTVLRRPVSSHENFRMRNMTATGPFVPVPVGFSLLDCNAQYDLHVMPRSYEIPGAALAG